MTADKFPKAQITLESIKRISNEKIDYWSSRELAKILGYAEYRNFLPVIEKAKEACNNSGHDSKDHFVDSHEMIDIGKNLRISFFLETVRTSENRCIFLK